MGLLAKKERSRNGGALYFITDVWLARRWDCEQWR